MKALSLPGRVTHATCLLLFVISMYRDRSGSHGLLAGGQSCVVSRLFAYIPVTP